MSDKLSGIFVSASGFLNGRPGGAQQCTTEYIQTLTAAGVELNVLSFELDRRLSSRLLKKVWPSSYVRHNEAGLIERLREMAERTKAKIIFLNQVQLASLAEKIRKVLPNCKIVVLSHGLESTDLLHSLRFSSDPPIALPKTVFGKQLLGDSLLRESAYRSQVDLVLCLSSFDVELERWIGTANAAWVPRTISPDPLIWNPSGNRLGFVGTLDHAPNLEGLLIFLRHMSEVAPAGVRVRIVGAPAGIGRSLMNSFPFADYLGPLSDDDLKGEASTWSAFIHPIFCYPRGCSTKLATAISWQIPIVTTTPGRRGYTWDRGALLVADSADEFTRLSMSLRDRETGRIAQKQVAEVAGSSPTITSVGRDLAELLGKLNHQLA